MIRVLSVLGSALGNMFRPRSRLAKAIAPLILLKIAIIVCARVFWFGPMIHHVVPGEVAEKFVSAPVPSTAGDTEGDHP